VKLLPEVHCSVANIISIDPGTETLGLCIMSVDVDTLEITSTQCRTYTGSKLPSVLFQEDNYNARYYRIKSHCDNLKKILLEVNPLFIVCESPFYNSRRPNAFEALTQVTTNLLNTCYEYNCKMPFFYIDPPTAKIAVGAKGNAKKEDMLAAVKNLTDLNYTGEISLKDLDEHSIDSIAIGYSKIVEWRKLRNPSPPKKGKTK